MIIRLLQLIRFRWDVLWGWVSSVLGFPAGLSRPGKSREGPGTGRDRTGSRNPEGPVVPGLKKFKSPGTFFEGPGTSRPLFLDRILLIRFKTKVHQKGSPLRFINKVQLRFIKTKILPKETCKARKKILSEIFVTSYFYWIGMLPKYQMNYYKFNM